MVFLIVLILASVASVRERQEAYDYDWRMLRFVILHHVLPAGSDRADHFDLMLEPEAGGQLLTWELPEFPLIGKEYIVRQLAPHRPAYLDYEGPISGERGEVKRAAVGTCNWLDRFTTARLVSPELATRLTIQPSDAPQELWRLRFAPLPSPTPDS